MGFAGMEGPPGRKRARRGPPPLGRRADGLPTVDDDGDPGPLFLESVHRGSHTGGSGAVPPALQEAVRNFSGTLGAAVRVPVVMAKLKKHRRGRVLTLAKFLHAVLGLRSDAHTSHTQCVISHFTGLSLWTTAEVLTNLRARGGTSRHCAGAGGRPSKAAGESAVVPDVGATLDVIEDLAVIPDIFRSSFAHGVTDDASGGISSTAVGSSEQQIGLRVARLAAPLGRELFAVCVCVVSFCVRSGEHALT